MFRKNEEDAAFEEKWLWVKDDGIDYFFRGVMT
jgi:hypothetical protein